MYGASGRRWGWHRLSPEHAAQLVGLARVTNHDFVIDLGAGDGSITSPLARTGARVLALELHNERFELLEKRFAETERVSTLHMDVRSLWLPTRPFKVVSNPPFDLTAEILRLLTDPKSQMASAHLVLERSAVRKLVERNRSRRFTMRHARNLPRSAFSPRPTVDIAVLEIRRAKR